MKREEYMEKWYGGDAPERDSVRLENPYWDIVKDLPGESISLRFDNVWSPDAYQMDRLRDRTDVSREQAAAEYEDFILNGPSRKNLVAKYAWAIPSPESIAWLVEQLNGRPVVEVGAGTGYWAWLLCQSGVDVNAYDHRPPGLGWNEYHCPREERVVPYTDEERREHQERWERLTGISASVVELNATLPKDQQYPVMKYPEFKPLPETAERQVLTGKPGNEWYPVQDGGPEVLARPENQTRVLFLCWPPYDDSMGHDVIRAFQGDTIVYIGEGWGGCNGTDEMFQLLEDEWEHVADGPLIQWGMIHDRLEIYVRKN